MTFKALRAALLMVGTLRLVHPTKCNAAGDDSFAHPGYGIRSRYAFAISRRVSPELLQIRLPLLPKGGGVEGNAGCALHPRSRVPKVALLIGAHEHTGAAEYTPTSPAQWLYGLLRALPGERALLPPSPLGEITPQALSASVAAPGPHDFAVRFCAFSSGAKSA